MSRKAATLFVIAVAVAAVWYWLGYGQLAARQSRIDGSIATARAKLADYDRTAAELPQILERLKEMEASRKDLLSQLYAKDDILRLFDQLEAAADQQSLAIKDLSPSLEELLELNRLVQDSDEPLFLTIGMTLEGDYQNYCRFVSELEQSAFCRGIAVCEAKTSRDRPGVTLLTVKFRALLGNMKDAA